jgi:predicted lactoylglutathione lyase
LGKSVKLKEVLMLFDHVDLRVSNLEGARPLYDALLPAMGYSRIVQDDDENICYYHAHNDRANAFFGLVLDPGHRPNESRIALRASSPEEIDRLAEIARAAGADRFEPPAVMADYTPFYYAAFFEDADGNKLELCYRSLP